MSEQVTETVDAKLAVQRKKLYDKLQDSEKMMKAEQAPGIRAKLYNEVAVNRVALKRFDKENGFL